MESREQSIRNAAAQLGFADCRFAAVQVPPHGEFVQRWLADGNAAGMEYLGKRLARRLDPAQILAGIRTVVSVSHRYAPPPTPPLDWKGSLRGRIAAYALGGDYHKTIGSKLDALAQVIEGMSGGSRALSYIDTGAILEREWGSLGGIGWFGKNTNLLHRERGSWFFIGEVLTTLDLEPDAPVSDHCGTCTRCLDLCPTGALKPGYVLDARRCISYWTIEHRGVIPAEMRPLLGSWVFGCDECQEVCPWNDEQGRAAAHDSPLLPYLPDLLSLSESQFEQTYRTTALWRTKREGLLRNAAVALGNSGNPQALPALRRALAEDPAPLVRAHAAWALGRIGGAAAHRGLEQCLATETHDDVLVEIRNACAALV